MSEESILSFQNVTRRIALNLGICQPTLNLKMLMDFSLALCVCCVCVWGGTFPRCGGLE